MSRAATGLLPAPIGFDKPFTGLAWGRALCQDLIASQCFSVPERLDVSPAAIRQQAPSAAELVLAAELEGRGQSHGALSMMVTSMVHMVQAGKAPHSRWHAS